MRLCNMLVSSTIFAVRASASCRREAVPTCGHRGCAPGWTSLDPHLTVTAAGRTCSHLCYNPRLLASAPDAAPLPQYFFECITEATKNGSEKPPLETFGLICLSGHCARCDGAHAIGRTASLQHADEGIYSHLLFIYLEYLIYSGTADSLMKALSFKEALSIHVSLNW